MSGLMVCLSIHTEAGDAVALGRLLERFGCRVLDSARDDVRVIFPEAATEAEALAEARLYLSLRPAALGGSPLAGLSLAA
ncbi:MAG: hypothetical protein V7644_948 [Actinomycetota bacterium]|jgi:hypothetical protein